MDLQAPALASAPGPAGLAEDLPCPQCQYNLRGLTVPRCPECGYGFNWSDVPQLRAETLRKRSSWREWFVLGVPSAVFGLLMLFTPLVILVLVAGGAFAVSAFQAGIEIAVAWPILRALSWKRFRAWWEGVLIGYGLCGLTCLLFGRPLIVLGSFALQRGPVPLALLLVITAAESLLVQWWVVRRRMRQWNDPVPARRLAASCLAAKTLVAIPWSLIAVGALAR